MTKGIGRTVVMVGLWVSVGLVFGIVLAERETPIERSTQTQPQLVPKRIEEIDRGFSVQVRPTFGQPPSIFSPASGLVDELTEDREFESGDVIVSIDGWPRLAMFSPRPMTRDVGFGDEGADVLAVQEFLLSLGVLADGNADGEFGAATLEAVRQYNRTWTPADSFSAQFLRSAVVWVPSADFAAGTQFVEPGQSVSVGERLFSGSPVLTHLRVVEPDDAPRYSDTEDWVLTIGSIVLPLDRESGAITDSLVAVEGFFDSDNAVDVTARVSLATPISAAVVPTSALIVDMPQGATCVFGKGPDGRTVSDDVQIVGGQLGVAFLLGVDSDSIVTNPAASLGAVSCS